jgi:beta-lactamase regulating signal transducer with metallopeptidase domain
MNAFSFLAEWAVRSSILIFGGVLLIWAARLKDPAVRLAAWIALLLGSLLIPVMAVTLPSLPLHLLSAAAPVQALQAVSNDFLATAPAPITAATEPAAFNWYRAALMLYVIVAAGMLLRLCVGLALSWRILRRSRRTDRGFLASRDIASPATLGILRPAVVLPEDWPQWDAGKLDSVLAHERSHIERGDPAIQLLSAVHRALLWFSPAAWFLHSKIVRTGEELSDDAAIAVTADRAAYAGVLVEFMQRRALPRHYVGVPMSRYGSTDRRIQRILDSSTLSRGMSWLGVITMLAIASPLAYFMSTAVPATAAPAPPPASPIGPTKSDTAPPQTRPGPGRNGRGRTSQTSLVGLGNVAASVVPVHTQMEGSLKSVNVQEGQRFTPET